MQLGPKAEDVSKPTNTFVFSLRFILGALAGMYYVLVPIYMWLKDQLVPEGQPIWQSGSRSRVNSATVYDALNMIIILKS